MSLGLIPLLVNFKIDVQIGLPIFQGRYPSFSVEWYRLVGSALSIQVALLIFTTNGVNLAFWGLAFMKRCFDRSCTCDVEKTRKVTQRDYNAVYTGPELNMDYKYANILVVTTMALTYGAGIPIMYLLAAVYFIVAYWTDKVLIFYNYRKP